MNMHSQAIHRLCIGATFAAALLAMGGCATWDHMSPADKGTAAGAVVGGVVGNAASGGGVLGTVGGAAVGGVIGREVGKR